VIHRSDTECYAAAAVEYRRVTVSCVACGEPLVEERLRGGQTLARCGKCGGVWMDVDEFLAVLRARQPRLALDELPEQNDGSPRRPCPRCGETMAIAWLEYLRLDQCADHGVWLDPGELDRALHGETRPPELARVLKPKAKQPKP
jgi:Zn-finger nucleic acid-binding protein